MKKECMKTICIVCPTGCHLTVESTPKGMIVKGNKCARGEKYGLEEASDPKRVVTAVVKTLSEEWPYVPVKTQKPVPKRVIPRLLKALYSLRVKLPVRRGRPVITDFGGMGIDVVFTRTFPPASKGREG